MTFQGTKSSSLPQSLNNDFYITNFQLQSEFQLQVVKQRNICSYFIRTYVVFLCQTTKQHNSFDGEY